MSDVERIGEKIEELVEEFQNKRATTETKLAQQNILALYEIARQLAVLNNSDLNNSDQESPSDESSPPDEPY